MGKPVNSNVKRADTVPLNMKVNKEVFSDFKDELAYRGHAMNTILETFMRQYANGRFNISYSDIIQWKDDDSEIDTLSTPINKEIYLKFKTICKDEGYFLKHVITAFMYEFTNNNYIMEFVRDDKFNKEVD